MAFYMTLCLLITHCVLVLDPLPNLVAVFGGELLLCDQLLAQTLDLIRVSGGCLLQSGEHFSHMLLSCKPVGGRREDG